MRTARMFDLLETLSLSLLFLLAFTSHAIALPKSAVRQTPEESEVRQQARAAVRSNRTLLGAWIEVESDPANPKILQLKPIFDSAKAKEQEAELKNVTKLLPRSNSYSIAAPQTWPLSRLVESLRSKIKSERSEFGGAGLRGAFFAFDDNAKVLKLVLVGHVATPGQKSKLATACDDILKSSNEWKEFQKQLKIVASPDQLESAAPLSPLAQSLRSKLGNAVRSTRTLLGSWVDVVHIPDVLDPQNKAGNHPGQFKFLLRIDAAKEAEQQRQLTRLVRELSPTDLQSSGIECSSWPFTSLLKEIQQVVAVRKADLGGCAVPGAYFGFKENAGVLQLVLLGHVASSATADVQRRKIVQLCDEILRKNGQWTQWQKTYDIVTNPDKLLVGPPINQFAQSVRRELAKTLSSTKSLEGAWLDLVHHPDVLEPESMPGTFSIQLVVDISRAGAGSRIKTSRKGNCSSGIHERAGSRQMAHYLLAHNETSR